MDNVGIKLDKIVSPKKYYLHHHIHVIELVLEMPRQHEGLEVLIEPTRLLQPVIQVGGGALLVDLDHHIL